MRVALARWRMWVGEWGEDFRLRRVVWMKRVFFLWKVWWISRGSLKNWRNLWSRSFSIMASMPSGQRAAFWPGRV